jgi:hypothetical protein
MLTPHPTLLKVVLARAAEQPKITKRLHLHARETPDAPNVFSHGRSTLYYATKYKVKWRRSAPDGRGAKSWRASRPCGMVGDALELLSDQPECKIVPIPF